MAAPRRLLLLRALVLLLAAAASTGQQQATALAPSAKPLLSTMRAWTSGRISPKAAGQPERMWTALAEYQDLEQRPGFAALSETELGVSLIDGAEFVAAALGEKALSVKYAQAMAATASCRDRRVSGDCFKDMASKALCRLHELRKNEEATAYFSEVVAVRTPSGQPLSPWRSEWQTPTFHYPDPGATRLDLFPDSPGHLTAKPWWDPFPDEPPSIVQVREKMAASFPAMQAEVISLLGEAGGWKLEGDHDAVTSGSWTEYMLYSPAKEGGGGAGNGSAKWDDAHCARVPTICKAVSEMLAVTGKVTGMGHDGRPTLLDKAPGQVTILRMSAGTRLAAHCGPQVSMKSPHCCPTHIILVYFVLNVASF